MFGIFKRDPLRSEIKKVAGLFFLEVGIKADELYVPFMLAVIQPLVDYGMTRDEIEIMAESSESKGAFMAGLCSEQMLAARNIWGSEIGERFESEVKDILLKIPNKKLKQYFVSVPNLFAHCRIDPFHTKLHILTNLLQSIGLGDSAVLEALSDNPLFQMRINDALSNVPVAIVKELAKHSRLPRMSGAPT